MVLTLVGLGLNDERDISIRGLEAIRTADIVYLENYTATLNVDTCRLVRHSIHRRRKQGRQLFRSRMSSCVASSVGDTRAHIAVYSKVLSAGTFL